MGREVRRVPKDWEHPRDEDGELIPMMDQVFAEVANAWFEEAIAWRAGTHENLVEHPELKDDYPFFWMWDEPPQPDHYRPAFTSEPTCYQLYETVTEGTPLSPVFETAKALEDWLVKQGHTRKAAHIFVREGHVPSAAMVGGKMYSGIDMLDLRDDDAS